MRTCEEYENMISAFIDGALEERDRAVLMEHMADCPVCQAYFDEQIAIHDALMDAAAAERIQAPAGFAESVMARITFTPQEKKPKKLPMRWRQWAALAACCAVAAAGLWTAGSRGSFDGGSAQMAVTSNAASGESCDAAPEETGGMLRAAPEKFAGNTSMDMAEDAPPEPSPAQGGSSLSESAPAPANRPASMETAPQMNGASLDGGGTDVPAGLMNDPAASKYETVPDPEAPMTAVSGGAPEHDAADSGGTEGNQPEASERTYERILTTSSPLAGAWVEEYLGGVWTGGVCYELTAEEYAQLRDFLTVAGENFTEEPGPAGSEGFLLASGGAETD